MLSLSAIETFYGETQALFGVSLEVRAGEVVALLGPNGAGKTTTLRSVLGLSLVRSGSIYFDEATSPARPRTKLPGAASAGCRTTGACFRRSPWSAISPLRASARKFRAWSTGECFEIFSALEYLLHRECENLSGGEMQMVAISRALLGSPGLVLLDEPSQGLAPRMVQQVLEVIRRLRKEGVAVLLVEQNPSTALSVADRVYVMDKGRVVHEGSAADLLHDASSRQRLLGV